MSQFFEEDEGGRETFRKKKEQQGIKGYWLLLIAIIVLSATLYGGMVLRENLPPLDILDKPQRVTGPLVAPAPAGMEMK